MPRLLQTSCILALHILTQPATAFELPQAAWNDNGRFALDFSSRVIDAPDVTWTANAIGLDVHKVFSSSTRDIGTLVFQPYLVRIDDAPSVPPIFDDNHDQALQWRIANFNFTALAQGRFNIRIGHFELPFGLEQIVQTNGTLNQMNAPYTTNLKADWGMSFNGVLPWFEYEIAHMRGGGNNYHTRADGALVARLGTPREHNRWIGISMLDGEIEAGAQTRDKQLQAIDAGVRLPRGLTLMTEWAFGETDAMDVRHAMAELGWTSRSEAAFFYLQYRRAGEKTPLGWRHARQVNVGARYEPSLNWSASLEFNRNVDIDAHITSVAQLRYRW